MGTIFSSYFLMLFALIVSHAVIPSVLLSSQHNLQLSFAQSEAPSQQEDNRPNILVIMGDDLGFSDIGSFGSEISTPNLDTLAKEGKILVNYHTNPACSPARLAFLTGVDNHIGGLGSMAETLAPNQEGKPGYEGYINDRVVTIEELLRDAGYHTMMTGKWHLSGQEIQNGTTPYGRGFEDVFTLLESGAQHFNGDPYYAGGHADFMRNDDIVERPDNGTYFNNLYTDVMLDQIKKYKDDGKPMFMYLAFQVGHSPFQAPQEFIKKYDGVYDVGYDKIREQRFEKQKELGIWPSDMKLPQRLPQLPAWDTLSVDEKEIRAKALEVHAAMIQDMDNNIGKVIQYLKEIGEYDNTLIMFTSDNGSSEPVEMEKFVAQNSSPEEAEVFLSMFNNTVSNMGNANSIINYGPRGAIAAVSPLSYFKMTLGEGGIRSPLVMKLPGPSPSPSPSPNPSPSNASQSEIVRAFIHVNDMTPTFLEYAGAPAPGSTYKGHPVHPIMGKSIKPLLEGKVEKIHADDESVAQEMFNNTAVFMGPWKAVKLFRPPLSDGKWHLFNITADIGENNDLASQHPEILQKLISDYDKFAKDVGVIVPQVPEGVSLQTIAESSD